MYAMVFFCKSLPGKNIKKFNAKKQFLQWRLASFLFADFSIPFI